jgi:hypothetical protein
VTRVAALFTRADSVYRSLGVECFDLARDARTFDLSSPVIAHPPCRSWGQLRHMSKPRQDERDLAVWAMWVVRHCGGVLEHPMTSGLWPFFGLTPGVVDQFGGVLVPVDQVAWGHRANKRTGLYCVRTIVRPRIGGRASTTVERMCRAERERTPVELARDLVRAAEAAA